MTTINTNDVTRQLNIVGDRYTLKMLVAPNPDWVVMGYEWPLGGIIAQWSDSLGPRKGEAVDGLTEGRGAYYFLHDIPIGGKIFRLEEFMSEWGKVFVLRTFTLTTAGWLHTRDVASQLIWLVGEHLDVFLGPSQAAQAMRCNLSESDKASLGF